MGIAAYGRCLADGNAAAAYACGAGFPVANAGIDSGGAAYSVVVECIGTVGTTMNLQRYRNGGSPSPQSVPYAGIACDEAAWLTYNPFALSATDGGLVAAAVVSVWGAAWAWKAINRTLRSGDSTETE